MDDPTQYFDPQTGDPAGTDPNAQVPPPDVSNPAINPGLQQYMQMLGLSSAGVPATGGGTVPGAIPTLPTAGGGAVPGYGTAPYGTFPSWLGLGISGQVAQAGPGLAAFGNPGAVNYTPPATPASGKSSSGGGSGGILGSIAGFL